MSLKRVPENVVRPTRLNGVLGPLLPFLDPLKKRDQKLYLQPTCNHPGGRNLHEQLGNETRSRETAGDYEQLKTVP